jgi:pilus assembly protein Flp/PilA
VLPCIPAPWPSGENTTSFAAATDAAADRTRRVRQLIHDNNTISVSLNRKNSSAFRFFGSVWVVLDKYATFRELLMKHYLAKFWSDESGATAIEYGLIAAGISLVIIAAVNTLGTSLSGKFTDINASLK